MKGRCFSARSFAMSCMLAFNLIAFFYSDFDAMVSGGFAASIAVSVMRTLTLAVVACAVFAKGMRNETLARVTVVAVAVYLLVRVLDAGFELAALRILGHAAVGVVGGLSLVYTGNAIATVARPHEAHISVAFGFVLAALLMLLAQCQDVLSMRLVRLGALVLFLGIATVLYVRDRNATFEVFRGSAKDALGSVRGIIALPLTAGVGPLATYAATVLLMFGFGLFETHISMSLLEDNGINNGSVFIALLLSVAMLLSLLIDDSLSGKNRFFLIVCTMMLAAVVGMALLPGFEGEFYTVLSAAVLVLQLPIFLFLYDMSNEGVPPAFLYALTQGIVGLAHVLGRLVAYVVSLVVGYENVTAAHIAAVVLGVFTLMVVVAIAFLVRSIDKNAVHLSPDQTPAAGENLRPSSREECLENLRQRYGLTDREFDIVSLYTQGRSVPFISTELNLARSTVKTHIGNVYSKMGIHTKQELLDALNE